MNIMEPKKGWLRNRPSLFILAAGIVGILAVVMVAAISLGYTPQRIVSYIAQNAPMFFADVQQEIKFAFAPKQVVAGSGNLDSAVFVPARTTDFQGPLRVHPQNPRYFTDDTGQAIYLTGSHTWSNLQDNGGSDPPPVFDYIEYLDFLEENNHNFFRLWTWEQSRWTVETSDDDYWFNPMPYQRPGPGNALDGKPKFDLEQFNQAYFDRIRARVISAGERGIYVSIMLFDGWSIESNKGGFGDNNPWRGHPFNISNNINSIDGDLNNDNSGPEVHTLQNPAVTAFQEAYVQKVIDTVNDLDNVLYEIANESHAGSNPWQIHLIDFIKDYEATKPKQHPVGMTVNWPGGDNSDLYNGPADWISPNGDVNNPPVGDGTKVILADTDHFCGICGDRQFVWKSFTNGLNPIFMDGYDGEGYGVGGAGFDFNNPTWVSFRSNLGYALGYANRMNLADAEPRGDLCTTGYCLANPTGSGSAEFLVYLPSGGSVTVNLSNVNGSVYSEWLNPSTGQVHSGGSTSGGGNRLFTAPFGGDAVLYLSQESQPLPTPSPSPSPSITPPVPGFRRFVPFVITSSLDWENKASIP